jgi:hypothetical protein
MTRKGAQPGWVAIRQGKIGKKNGHFYFNAVLRPELPEMTV